ncbi:hypothetical protein LNO78_20805 [Klebsiella pneumoniae subsp. pneumoniae]|nr:hypothetical protein [Klebsiella pneumoniae subsp. pneumoniae]
MQMRQRMRGGCAICNSARGEGRFQCIDFKRLIFYSPLA